jgi:predicted regulator of Ras-like GTPase activity (Roadblock/LC7/MglB family)
MERVSLMAMELKKLNDLTGFIGACVVDSDTGMVMAMESKGGLDLELAAAGNTEVVRAKRRTIASLNMRDEIEDILISLKHQYHIIRLLRNNDRVFIYVAIDRNQGNLALARVMIQKVEETIRL